MTHKKEKISISYGNETATHYPTFATEGMVSTVDPYATKVGRDILADGGSAIDAAVAIGFALAVTHPQAGNLGGGGFMVFHPSKGEPITLNFREKAPLKATETMFQNEKGEVDSNASLTGYRATAVPGTVKGLLHALDHYGTMDRDRVLAPAITLAEKGFPILEGLSSDLEQYGGMMREHPESRSIFFRRRQPLKYGECLIQTNLANSLRLIAAEGEHAFYQGAIADKIVAAMAKNGGLIDHNDLERYTIETLKPVTGTYRGYRLYSMAPPSSGGIHLIQLLNILENFDLKSMGHNSAASIHIITEAIKYAYADRHEYLGDPNFVDVPTHFLLNKAYAKQIAEKINRLMATPSEKISAGRVPKRLLLEPTETTHYSVMDRWGNAVAVTYTLNSNFGSGIIPEGTGILLNNIMDNFSAKAGEPNLYGIIGSERNKIEPEKRPLSCMAPTIVTKGFKPIFVTGSPGGSRIITIVLQMVLNLLEYDLNIAEATNAPRFHHQWWPDILELEKGFSIDTIDALKMRGYSIKEGLIMGATHSVAHNAQGFYGSEDPRTPNGTSLGVDNFSECKLDED